MLNSGGPNSSLERSSLVVVLRSVGRLCNVGFYISLASAQNSLLEKRPSLPFHSREALGVLTRRAVIVGGTPRAKTRCYRRLAEVQLSEPGPCLEQARRGSVVSIDGNQQLSFYQAKRDSRRPRQPSGRARVKPAKRLRFVIRSMPHRGCITIYGWKSTACSSRGPSPRGHLSIHVIAGWQWKSRTALDYGDFEGIIPQGEYGGGTVMLWDRGFWRPMMAAIRNAHFARAI